VEHEIVDPGGGADDNVPGGGSINSVEHELDDPGGGAADDDPGGGSITSADADSALIVQIVSNMQIIIIIKKPVAVACLLSFWRFCILYRTRAV
jgi:hypothetical protein